MEQWLLNVWWFFVFNYTAWFVWYYWRFWLMENSWFHRAHINALATAESWVFCGFLVILVKEVSVESNLLFCVVLWVWHFLIFQVLLWFQVCYDTFRLIIQRLNKFLIVLGRKVSFGLIFFSMGSESLREFLLIIRWIKLEFGLIFSW